MHEVDPGLCGVDGLKERGAGSGGFPGRKGSFLKLRRAGRDGEK